MEGTVVQRMVSPVIPLFMTLYLALPLNWQGFSFTSININFIQMNYYEQRRTQAKTSPPDR